MHQTFGQRHCTTFRGEAKEIYTPHKSTAAHVVSHGKLTRERFPINIPTKLFTDSSIYYKQQHCG